jgi:hypothetical protein
MMRITEIQPAHSNVSTRNKTGLLAVLASISSRHHTSHRLQFEATCSSSKLVLLVWTRTEEMLFCSVDLDQLLVS